jgi:hypothetical protein
MFILFPPFSPAGMSGHQIGQRSQVEKFSCHAVRFFSRQVFFVKKSWRSFWAVFKKGTKHRRENTFPAPFQVLRPAIMEA